MIVNGVFRGQVPDPGPGDAPVLLVCLSRQNTEVCRTEGSPGWRWVLCSLTAHATKQSSESSASRTSALHRKVFQPSCRGSQLCRFGEMSLMQMAWKSTQEIIGN